MARKEHYNLYSEYDFLVKKVGKLKERWTTAPLLQKKRQMKKARQFIRRMLEITQTLNDMGYPHPEARYQDDEFGNLTNPLLSTASPHLMSMDGSLSPKMVDALATAKEELARKREEEVDVT